MRLFKSLGPRVDRGMKERILTTLLAVIFLGAAGYYYVRDVRFKTAQAAGSIEIGTWKTVDFVDTIESFNPSIRSWKGELYLDELTFKKGGKTNYSFLTWEPGVLHQAGEESDAAYFIQIVDEEYYLFLEWMSADVTRRGRLPKYYVLKRQPSMWRPLEWLQDH